MLRRSLFLFSLFVLLGLGLTALYAILRLRGAEDVLAEARQLLQRGEHVQAVKLLDLCEPGAGMQGDREALLELWRLRLEAHRRLDNTQRALRDLQSLLGAGVDDASLQLDRIYYLARSGDGETARRHALAFLERHPGSARGHELAGEAIQVCYQPELRAAAEQVRSDLGRRKTQLGTEALLAFLYRQDGDPAGALALRALQELYAQDPRHQQTWSRLRDRITQLRISIQQSLDHFQRALELADPKGGDQRNYFAAAFRGVSFAMQQAGRDDDLLLQAEIYLGAHEHRYAVEAAVAAAEANYRAGLDAAAIEMTQRFLPPGTLAERMQSGRVDAGIEPLLIVEALAALRLQNRALLDRRSSDMLALGAVGIDLPLPRTLINGFGSLLRQDRGQAEANLQVALRLAQQRPKPLFRTDLLPLLVPLQLDQLRARQADGTELLAVVADWIRARDGEVAPLLARANLQLQLGQYAAAMSSAGDVLKLSPQEEAALVVMAGAAELLFRESAQDGDSLLLQCLQRSALRPEVPHPICYLLCGESALRQRHYAVARECARAAIDSFPWSRWPRHLEVRTALAARDDAAITLLEQGVRVDPEDRDAVAMWFQAVDASGALPTRYLSRAVAQGEPDRARAVALLRLALLRGSPHAREFALTVAAAADADGEALAHAARAMAQTGAQQIAQELLQRARERASESITPGSRSPRIAQALTAASLAWLVAVAQSTPDDALSALAGRELAQQPLEGRETASALLAAAETMTAAKRPRTAYLLATTALAMHEAIELRDATSLGLAGRLALDVGEIQLATAHFTAAVSFQGGDAAVEPLARCLLVQGERERAAEALALIASPSDPALALCKGDRELAFHLAQQRVLADPGDLLAQVAFASMTQVDPDVVGAELARSPAEQVRAILELVAALAEPRLASAALPRLRAMAAQGSQTIRLLLARALVDAGHGTEASALHDECFAAGSREAPLFTEAIRATSDPGYLMPAAMRAALLDQLAAEPDTMPVAAMVFALRALAADAAAAGNLVVAAKILADLWQRFPHESGVRVQDCLQLLGQGQVATAILLLDELRLRGPPAQRRAAGQTMFLAGQDHGQGPVLEAHLRRAALAELHPDGLVGPALAFLLADPRRALEASDAALGTALQALLEDCSTGRDEWSLARTVLAHLRTRLGSQELLAAVERHLDRDPTALPLWLERARLSAGHPRNREKTAEARTVLSYIGASPLRLELALLALAQRELAPDDVRLLQQLSAEERNSPRGLLATGLVALRQGRAADAIAPLEATAEDGAGLREFALALAELQLADETSRADAARWLQQLRARHPDSQWARYADSFLRQLGVR